MMDIKFFTTYIFSVYVIKVFEDLLEHFSFFLIATLHSLIEWNYILSQSNQ